MGLFNWFKKSKAKTFELPPQSDNLLVQAFSYSMARVSLGDTLIVKKGWVVVLVAKDKALDVFTEGEHKFNLGAMPNLTKALKLDVGKKVRRKGSIVVELPKDFLCDIYFVNTKVFENRIWRSDSIKFKIKKKEYIKFWVQGRFDVSVKNAHEVIKLFLIDWGFIRSDMALGKIDFLVSEFLSEEIAKIKAMMPEEFAKQETFDAMLKPKLDHKFEKYGLQFSNVGIEEIVYQKNIAVDVSKQEEQEMIDEQSKDEIAELTTEKQQETNNKDTEENKEDNNKELVVVGAKKKKINKAANSDAKEATVELKADLPKEAEKKEDKTEGKAENKTQTTSVFDMEVEKPKLSGRRKQTLNLCKNCGEILKTNSTKCQNCGVEAEDKKADNVCPQCGKDVKQDAAFCECGCYLPPKEL